MEGKIETKNEAKQCYSFKNEGWCPKGTLCQFGHDYDSPADITTLRSQLDGVIGGLVYMSQSVLKTENHMEKMRDQINKIKRDTENIYQELRNMKEQLNDHGIPILHTGDELFIQRSDQGTSSQLVNEESKNESSQTENEAEAENKKNPHIPSIQKRAVAAATRAPNFLCPKSPNMNSIETNPTEKKKKGSLIQQVRELKIKGLETKSKKLS